jgi:hypothetical protein
MQFKLVLAAMLAAGSIATAQATPVTWVDTIDFTPDRYIAPYSSYSYTHSILDNGYNPGVDSIYNYSLSVNLLDDSDRGLDVALINVPGLFGDTIFFNLSGVEFGGWSLEGQTQLSNTGIYGVTITSLIGDFFLGGSSLTVRGEENDGRSVPEPGTLGLLGLGLLGVGAGMRKKKKAQAQ